MSKQRESKLDRHAETLVQMEAEKQTLAQMVEWLQQQGINCSLSSLSRFLEAQRSARLQAKLLHQISSGARQCREVEKQFATSPAPELETLIKLQRVILLTLSTQAGTDPSALELIGNSFKAVMDSEKLKLKREELALARNRFEWDAAQECLKRLPDLKAVSDAPKLSADEKAKAIQQILFPKS